MLSCERENTRYFPTRDQESKWEAIRSSFSGFQSKFLRTLKSYWLNMYVQDFQITAFCVNKKRIEIRSLLLKGTPIKSTITSPYKIIFFLWHWNGNAIVLRHRVYNLETIGRHQDECVFTLSTLSPSWNIFLHPCLPCMRHLGLLITTRKCIPELIRGWSLSFSNTRNRKHVLPLWFYLKVQKMFRSFSL